MARSSVSKLRAHVKNVRKDIERKGVLVDEDINVALRKMLYAGRRAIEQGIEPKDSKGYLEAAANLHKVVRGKQKGSGDGESVPLVSYRRFPKHKKRVVTLNARLKKTKHPTKGLEKLVHLANSKAKSDHEFEYFLKEIEWLLR
ncbi:MAG: hypothetical protein LN415_03325 [Candidatus Thermoplasmatota archaeon]|nr:hypothetical protein [Candidatus Thermoplasmatota archaeon]